MRPGMRTAKVQASLCIRADSPEYSLFALKESSTKSSLLSGRKCAFKVLHAVNIIIEPLHDKTNNMGSAPSEDSDQPGHPYSLIRVFAVRPMES